MSAPDLLTVCAWEAAVEAAQMRILTAMGAAVFAQGGIANLTPGVQETDPTGQPTTPRFEVKVESGGEGPHRAEFTPGQKCGDSWAGMMTTRIITSRNRDEIATQLRAIAAVRLEAQYFRDRFNATILPYHVVTMVRESGVARGIEATEDTDTAEFTHDIIVSVRKGAWPE